MPHRHSHTYRYVPPEQAVAGAATYIEEVRLQFALRFTGSLLIECVDDGVCPQHADTEESPALQVAGAALDRIADGLFVSAVRGDEPQIESACGHRFTHQTSCLTGTRTRRFAGQCVIELADGAKGDTTITGCLQYTLDVTAAAPSDPMGGTDAWSERYDRSLASIGAVVLAPVPVTADRAARLYPARQAS